MSDLLLITRCADPLLWYARLVGQAVPLLHNLPAEQCWMSREPAGYRNIVKHTDAVPLPRGFTSAAPHTMLQRGDLIYINGQWLPPALMQLGTPVAGHIAIRKDNT